MAKKRILFILKRREDFDPNKHSQTGLSTGLFNSASFVKDMLVEAGIDARLEVAIDNNCIDRLVTKHRPTHVIIEALWVVPTKFDVLTRLHPTVMWIIRLHSEMPFLANEGMAMDWLGDYLTYPQVRLGINSPRMLIEVKNYLRVKGIEDLDDSIFFMPNYYPQQYKVRDKKWDWDSKYIDIACFGAIRPLKNHLTQALAAVIFADKIEKQLRFHINLGRVEMKGEPILHNLRGLFEHLYDAGHRLVSHEWVPRSEFLKICSDMDIGMQCNFSETFNIVSADLLSQGVPVITSKEIPWAADAYNADPTDVMEMVRIMNTLYFNPKTSVMKNQKNLTKYTNRSRELWTAYFKEE